MVDVVNSAVRSRMMSGIRGKNTKPELQVRQYLHRLGFRYSLHRRDLPGRPDLTLAKRGAVVFVHGCFWHSHAGCRLAAVPSTRPDFWKQKLGANADRDRRNLEDIRNAGWRVAIVWECALRSSPDAALAGLVEFLKSRAAFAEFASDHEPRIE